MDQWNTGRYWPVNDADLGGSGRMIFEATLTTQHVPDCTKSWARDGPEIDALKATQRRQINLSKQKHPIGCWW